MTALEPYAGGDRNRLKQLHQLASAEHLIPDSFKAGRKAGGAVDWGAVALACDAAESLGMRPVQNLWHFPVINNTVWPDAEVYRVLAARHGWSVTFPVDEPDRIEVDMVHLHTGQHPPRYPLTLKEARQLGSAKTNPTYDTAPRAMLQARASRAAIRLNAPDVMTDPVTATWGDEISGPAVLSSGADTTREGSDRGTSGPFESGDGSLTAGPDPAPSVPPRRPVSDAARVRLIEAIEGLPDGTKEDLRRACRDVELPNVMSSDVFNMCDAALLERLITEALARAEMYAYTEEEMAPFEP